MASAFDGTPPVRRLASSTALWFGLFGAGAAWSVQELVSYGMTARECIAPARSMAAGAGGLAVVVSAALVLVGAAALLVAHRSQRRLDGGRARFMAHSGVLLSGVFLMGLVANFVVLFLVPACG